MTESKNKDLEIDLLLVDDESNFLEQEKIFLQREKRIINPDTETNPKKAIKK